MAPPARLVFVMLLALGVRLGLALVPFDYSGPDSVTYLEPARSLARGEGYLAADGTPSASRPPGYPAFLAVVFLAFGDGPGGLAAVRGLQALLGALAVGLVHEAVRATAPAGARPAAIVAAVTLAVDPVSAGQGPFLLREALLTFGVAALVRALTLRPARVRALAVGLTLAGLALTHQLYVLVGPFLALADLGRAWGRAGPRAALRRLPAWVLAGVLVAWPVTLWALRNERVTGHRSFTLAQNAVVHRELWLTVMCPNAWLPSDPATGYQESAFTQEGHMYELLGLEGTRRELLRRAAEAWREHPLRSLGRTLRINAWYWLELPGAVRLVEHPRLFVARWGALPLHWARLVAAAAGLWFVLRDPRWARLRPLAALVAFFALAPALLYPIPRYLAPACPVLAALAGVALATAPRPAWLRGAGAGARAA